MGLSLLRWGTRIPQAIQGNPPPTKKSGYNPFLLKSAQWQPLPISCQVLPVAPKPLPSPAQSPLYLSGLSWYLGDSTVSSSGTRAPGPLHSLTFFPGHPFPGNPSSCCLTSFWCLHTSAFQEKPSVTIPQPRPWSSQSRVAESRCLGLQVHGELALPALGRR